MTIGKAEGSSPSSSTIASMRRRPDDHREGRGFESLQLHHLYN